MALSIEDQIDNLAGKMVDLASKSRKQGIAEARKYLAERLVEMVSGKDGDANLLACLEGTDQADYMVTPDFRAGARWAAAMIAAEDFDY
jgi:hypothetical protein